MNKDDFFKEVINSGLCPSNFDNIYSEFKEYQRIADETLSEFHRICEKNNINYQLAFGSLLGAIRDNGQIPWDYDVDVIIPIDEKEKLIECLKKDLSDDFYFYCPEIDENCRHVFIRVTPKGYRTEVLHVDVFFLIGTPNNEKDRVVFVNKIKEISNNRYAKLVKFFDEKIGLKNFIKKILYKIKTVSYNSVKSYDMFQYLCSKYPLKSSQVCITADTFAGEYEFYFEDIDFYKTKLIKTNIGEFRIPLDYDKILNNIYGNYNEYPPLKDRIEETLNSYKRLKKFAKK